jgi:hypothetical protein
MTARVTRRGRAVGELESASTREYGSWPVVHGAPPADEARMKHLSVCLLVAACSGGSSDLDADVVTSLPPGDATGTAMTGSYRMETITTDCAGTCSTSADGIIYSACDIGTRLENTVMITQTDGALRIDVDDSDYVSRLEGGLDASGAFDVGGLVTQLGTLAGTTMTGVGRLRVRGRGLDCHIEVDASGTRR